MTASFRADPLAIDENRRRRIVSRRPFADHPSYPQLMSMRLFSAAFDSEGPIGYSRARMIGDGLIWPICIPGTCHGPRDV